MRALRHCVRTDDGGTQLSRHLLWHPFPGSPAAGVHGRSTHPCRRQQRTPSPSAASSQDHAGSSRSGGAAASAAAPWAFGVQTNERLLQWDDTSKLALMRIWLARQQGITPEEARGWTGRAR